MTGIRQQYLTPKSDLNKTLTLKRTETGRYEVKQNNKTIGYIVGSAGTWNAEVGGKVHYWINDANRYHCANTLIEKMHLILK